MDKIPYAFMLLMLVTACTQSSHSEFKDDTSLDSDVFVSVLGIVQDAGYPQINCKKSCCVDKWQAGQRLASVSCLGIGDRQSDDFFIVDATPDFKYQLSEMQSIMNTQKMPSGVFLTHAHIGHYTGLMDLGREAMGADSVKVHAMPKMEAFLTNNGPWSQLVSLKNINISPLENNRSEKLTDKLTLIPFIVPHRDEFSETVGYLMTGPSKSMLFIPDIDKWSKWDQDIIQWIAEVDYALLDGTFFRNGEIFGRDMSQIPHPFIEESTQLFDKLPTSEKSKIYFIHLNHTNPLLDRKSEEFKAFNDTEYNLAYEGQVFAL